MPVKHIIAIPRLDEGGWKVRILVDAADDRMNMNIDLPLQQARDFSDDLAEKIERIRAASSALEGPPC